MKLISLNIWGGKLFDEAIYFIKTHSENANFFCFQEMLDTDTERKEIEEGYRANLLKEIKNTLVNFNFVFSPYLKYYNINGKKTEFQLELGQIVFYQKDIKLWSSTEHILLGERFIEDPKEDFSNTPVLMQEINFEVDGQKLSVFNIHGASMPGHKLDTPKRLVQSQKIKSIIDKNNNPKILAGDFNLMPETESIAIIESCMVNLIKTFKIENTRGSRNFFNGQIGDQKYADYTFVSKEINVNDFKVPDAKISDHCPMILEFEL